MKRGYIVLWRCIRDNHFWQDKPFDRCRAWIDLIMMANHTDGVIRSRGISIPVLRGQVGTSEVIMADKWGWSRGKVRRFLTELRKKEQIVQQNNNVTSLITITNYDLYQFDGTTNSTADSTPNGTANGQQTDSKQYPKKELKKEKKKPIEHFENAQEIFDKCWAIYPRKEGRIEAEKHFKKNVLSKEDARELFTAIQRYKEMVSGREIEHIKHGSSFFYNWRDYATANFTDN